MNIAESEAYQPKGVKIGGDPAIQEIIYVLCLVPDSRILMLRRGFKSGAKVYVGPWGVSIFKRIKYGYEITNPEEAAKDLVCTYLNPSDEYTKDHIIISHADSFMKNGSNYYYTYIVELREKLKITLNSTMQARAISERDLSKLLFSKPDLFFYETRVVLVDRLGFDRAYR